MSRPTESTSFGALRHVFFAYGTLAAILLAVVLTTQAFAAGWTQAWFVLVVYLVIAYLVLPRIHRALSRIYLPDYFIGRTRTREGILGDPVNLAMLGEGSQLHMAMRAAGWTRADELGLRANLRIVTSTLLRRSYPAAPVSNLYLFGRQQAFCYQQEVDGSPGRRHHVRFWATPADWLLPGGGRVDWLASGSYDRGVGLSFFTAQVTHRIADDVDVERDHIVASLLGTSSAVGVSTIENFSTGHHSRNGGGDAIVTDGDLPIVDLGAVDESLPAFVELVAEPRADGRPIEIWIAAVAMFLRAAAALVLAINVGLMPSASGFSGADGDVERVGLIVFAGVIAAGALLDLVLGVFVFRGGRRAWIGAMLVSGITIAVIAIAALKGDSPTLQSGLLAFALDIAILLALSGPEVWDWSRRRRKAR